MAEQVASQVEAAAIQGATREQYAAAGLADLFDAMTGGGSSGRDHNHNGNSPNSPTVDPPDFDSVPQALRERPQWVLWTIETRKGKFTKLPKQISGSLAKSNDPSTWTTFDKVRAAFNPKRHAGIGYVFAADDPYCGIDLDGCRNPETGELAGWASEILDRFGTYAEVSPTSTGLKMFLAGEWPTTSKKKIPIPNAPRLSSKEPALEVYDRLRYFAVTGKRVEATPSSTFTAPTSPADGADALDWLREKYYPTLRYQAGGANGSTTNLPKTGRRSPEGRCRAYLETLPDSIQGQDGSGRIFAAACICFRFGLDDGPARDLLNWFGTAKSDPPWESREIDHKLIDAKEAVNADGSFGSMLVEAVELPNGELATEAKPTIVIGVDEDRVVTEAVAAIRLDDKVFRRGTMLVSIFHDTGRPKGIKRPPNSPRIGQIPLPIVRERLAANIKWVTIRMVNEEPEEVPAHPPMWAVNAVNARGEWPGIRCLEGVVESPVIRHDGTVLETPGYDDVTGLYYEPNCQFPPMPADPTIEDAKAAVDILSEVVCDFQWDKEFHRSAWFASILTPFARFAYEGPTPLFLIEANIAGTGKSLLCDVNGHIAAGREMSRMSYPSDDDEMRKNITSTALAGDRLVLIDNIGGTFGTPSLDAMLTAGTWRDRMLGKNETTGDIPMTTIWYATANNVVLNGDISRRICPIRLRSLMEKPEERTGFRHENLMAWVRENRGRLVVACLTILRAYVAAGRPLMKLTPWGSYTGWSDLVRSAIVWAGLTDPAEAKTEMRAQSDRGGNILKMLIDGLEEFDPYCRGKTVREIVDVLDTEKYDKDSFQFLKNALFELGGKAVKPGGLGMKLHHMKDKISDGKYLCRIPGKTPRWTVIAIGDEFHEPEETQEPDDQQILQFDSEASQTSNEQPQEDYADILNQLP